ERPSLRAAARRQPALSGEGGGLPRPELREDHQDQRDRDRPEGDRAGRRGRMGRAHHVAPASGEGAMKNMQEKRNMTTWRAIVVTAMLSFGAALSAQAENLIQSINSTQQAGAEVVRIELSEALPAVPNGFAIQAPPRIAIDLPGVGNGMGRPTVDVNQ